MLGHGVALFLSANFCFAQAPTKLSGTWVFTHANNRLAGTVVLHQSGTDLTGTWHTSRGKTEADTPVAGRVDGMTVVLTRFIGENQQNYILTLSPDGSRLDGFGDGWFLHHTNLDMARVAASAKASAGRTSSPRGAQTGGTPTLWHESAAVSSSSAPSGTPVKKQTWMGIGLPPPRGTYRWVIQSVVVRAASGKKYSSFYYEESTGRSVEQPLSLPTGGEIVGVFPDDCKFSVQDQSGNSFTFRGEDEAKAKGLGAGTWSVYPLKCGGIAVYVK